MGLLVFAVFSLALWAPFIYDDLVFIFGNPDVLEPWKGWAHFFLHPYFLGEAYEPVIVGIHRWLFFYGGDSPFLYRLTSILLHWANCALFYGLLRKLLKSPTAAFCLAAVFAVYPAHTEVLAISTFKKHLIVAFCGLLMIHLVRPWREEAASWWRRALCFPLLILACLTKEHGLLLPPILAVLSLCVAGDWRARARRDVWFFGGLFALCAGFAYFRSAIVPHSIGRVVGNSWALHWLTSAKIFLWYVRELALPWQLCQEQSLAPVSAVLSWQTLGLLAGLGACAAAGLTVWRRDRVAFAGLAIACIWLAPFLNILPFLNLSLVANRYLYLAIAGALLCVGRLTQDYWSVKWDSISPMALACALVALGYASLGMRNLARYSDPVDLWTCAANCAPDNARAHASLGSVLAVHLQFAEGIRELRLAVKLSDDGDVRALENLAEVYAQSGDMHRAELLVSQVVKRVHDNPALRLYGSCKLRDGDFKAAKRAFLMAVQHNPMDGVSRMNLGLIYLHDGDYKQALVACRAAMGIKNYGSGGHKCMAAVYLKEKRFSEAREQYELSLQEQPIQLDVVNALAILYARKGQADKGVALFDQLIRKIETGRKHELGVESQIASPEDELSRDILASAHRARATFLQHYPTS